MQNKQLYENTASLTHFSIQDLNNKLGWNYVIKFNKYVISASYS